MGSTQPLPNRQDLEVLAHAAFVNSRQLLATAELLLENDRWPVAHALATLALEEIGKSFLRIFASTNPEPFRADFREAFVSRTTKIQIAHVIQAPMTAAATSASRSFFQAIESSGQTAKADHSMKMRGMSPTSAPGSTCLRR